MIGDLLEQHLRLTNDLTGSIIAVSQTEALILKSRDQVYITADPHDSISARQREADHAVVDLDAELISLKADFAVTSASLKHLEIAIQILLSSTP